MHQSQSEPPGQPNVGRRAGGREQWQWAGRGRSSRQTQFSPCEVFACLQLHCFYHYGLPCPCGAKPVAMKAMQG